MTILSLTYSRCISASSFSRSTSRCFSRLPIAFWLVSIVTFFLCLPSAQARLWRDKSGDFSVEADFVELKNDSVVLKKQNGKTISVPLSRLSRVDQRYVASLKKKPPAPVPTSPSPNIPKPDAPKPVANSLDGSWQVVKLTSKGKEAPAEIIKLVKFIFSKDKLIMEGVQGPGTKHEWSCKFDTKQSPKHFELRLPDDKEILLGIYKLEKSKLVICYKEIKREKDERPTTFESTLESRTVLVELTKQAEK